MAAFNFPNSPSTNDTHTENGVEWKWNGSVWKRVESVGEKGQKGEDNSTKGQKGEVGADNSTKGQKGEVGADNSTKGQKGELGTKGETGARGFTVTNSGASDYIIDGANDPTLTLLRGFTYIFSVNASGHPFWIKTASVTGTGSAYSSGVTNNGTASGDITFAVPYNAPNTLYYICQYHSGMAGTINISDAGQKGEKGQKGEVNDKGQKGAPGSDAVFVTGMIIIWNGAANAVPSGWTLCDGTNSAPDLTAKFIIGAKGTGDYQPGYTGGYTDVFIPEHTHSYSGSVVANGSHNHSVKASHTSHSDNDATGYPSLDGESSAYRTHAAGNSWNTVPNNSSGGHWMDTAGSHQHTYSGTTANNTGGAAITNAQRSGRNLPPYYALCYIMKT